jgi:molecular chaperone GrpE
MNEEEKKEIEELRKNLEECQKLKEEYLASWQRARADLLNYKKEEMTRVGELLKYTNESLILKILPILDNFDLAIRQQEKNADEKTKALIEGFIKIKKQLEDFLREQGVEEIKTVGERFDPNFHEAVEIVEKEGEKDIILEELQKGYMLGSRLLRPAKVKVAK